MTPSYRDYIKINIRLFRFTSRWIDNLTLHICLGYRGVDLSVSLQMYSMDK